MKFAKDTNLGITILPLICLAKYFLLSFTFLKMEVDHFNPNPDVFLNLTI